MAEDRLLRRKFFDDLTGMHCTEFAAPMTAGFIVEAWICVDQGRFDLIGRWLIHSMAVDDMGNLEASALDFPDATHLVGDVIAITVCAYVPSNVIEHSIRLSLSYVKSLAVSRVDKPIHVEFKLLDYLWWERLTEMAWHFHDRSLLQRIQGGLFRRVLRETPLWVPDPRCALHRIGADPLLNLLRLEKFRRRKLRSKRPSDRNPQVLAHLERASVVREPESDELMAVIMYAHQGPLA